MFSWLDMVRKVFLLKKLWLKLIVFFLLWGRFIMFRVDMWNIWLVFLVLEVVMIGVLI